MQTSLRALGEKHPNTIITMENLALTYRKQGQWKEAEELHVQVIQSCLRVLGERNILTSLFTRWKCENIGVRISLPFMTYNQ